MILSSADTGIDTIAKIKVIAKNKLIIAGSIYQNGINHTVVFNNKNKYLIRKYNASGAEPMIRYQENISTEDFIKYHLNEHMFTIKDKFASVEKNAVKIGAIVAYNILYGRISLKTNRIING